MKRKDLLVFGAGRKYDHPMTDAELWVAVGRELAARRQERGFPSPHAFSTSEEHRSGARVPDIATVKKIEQGKPRTLAVLSDYCDLLGTRLEEVLGSVMPSAETPLKLRALVRQFSTAEEWLQESILGMLRAHHAARPTPPGDGKLAPAKKPSRSERSR